MKFAIRHIDQWISITPRGTIEYRSVSNPPGPWETFEMVNLDPVTVPPTIPSTYIPYNQWTGSDQDWFLQIVKNKPFGQQTLLDLEVPILNPNGWRLTPPNSVGERTKLGVPNLQNGVKYWVRVGFGEGHWVWVVQ